MDSRSSYGADSVLQIQLTATIAFAQPSNALTANPAVGTSFHDGEVVPEVLEAFGATEQRGEVSRVHQHDVAPALSGGRHPDQRVELGVTGRSERMRPVRVDALAAQHTHGVGFRLGEFVVRKVGMEIERGDLVEQ